MKNATWSANDGYSGCQTAYKGDFAIVICPPDFAGGRWEIQVFDEGNEDAMESGETLCRVELDSWLEEDDVKVTAEMIFF